MFFSSHKTVLYCHQILWILMNVFVTKRRKKCHNLASKFQLLKILNEFSSVGIAFKIIFHWFHVCLTLSFYLKVDNIIHHLWAVSTPRWRIDNEFCTFFASTFRAGVTKPMNWGFYAWLATSYFWLSLLFNSGRGTVPINSNYYVVVRHQNPLNSLIFPLESVLHPKVRQIFNVWPADNRSGYTLLHVVSFVQ